MAKTPKPRWGWSPEWDTADLDGRMGRVDFRKMAAVVGAKGEAARARFERDYERALSMYHFSVARSGDPSRVEISRALKEVRRRATPLLEVLGHLDEKSAVWIDHGFARDPERPSTAGANEDAIPYGPTIGEIERAQLVKGLGRLLAAIDTIMGQAHPAKRGRKANEALATLIVTLADIYEEHANTPAYAKFSYDPESRECGGPFFLFVEASLSAFMPDKPISNNGLGEAIRREIGNR